MMKITSDSAIKAQINQIAAQIKWLKTQEANASQNNLPMYVKMFQNERRQLVKSFNVMIGSPNSVKGIQYGERRWLSNITKGFVKPYGRAVQILSVTK